MPTFVLAASEILDPFCRGGDLLAIAAGLFLALAIELTVWAFLGSKSTLLISVPLLVLAQLETYHVLVVGMPTTIGMIGALFDINPNEGFDLVGSTLAIGTVCILLLVIQSVIAWKARGLDWSAPSRRIRWRTMVLVPLFFLPEAVHLWTKSPPEPFVRSLVAEALATAPFGTIAKIGQALASKRLLEGRSLRIRDFDWKALRTEEAVGQETYLLILGESSRSGNWSLYGYHRTTTPMLDSDTSIGVVQDFVSGANNTSESLPLYLTLATADAPERFDSTSSILACLRQAGFKTWWLSTQTQFGGWDNKSTLIGKEADVSRFLDYENGTIFDHGLLPLLDSANLDTASKKFIVLHTMGSHFQYEHRYPSSFERFPIPDAKKNSLPAYDNSILYTDWFVDQAISRIRALPGIRAVLYIGDHGESFGENGCILHSNPKPSRAEFEVPFLVWTSPELDRSRPEVVANLRSHTKAQASSADFLPTLLDIVGIHTHLVDPSRSLAQIDYRSHTRWGLLLPGTTVDIDLLSGSSRNAPRRAP
ncbi:MAG: sulfatase-like hydrolase/transferase [Fibrobacteres bacterium]|jgi:glucan phosphoethanolaminetransferase (alkaline phosphatase superfamily)|nr:sulfatase-like hydrolase/transferase [Fibrobacterota bacterium]